MDYIHYYNFYFAKSGREEVFKIGQPEDEELHSLSQKIGINWRWLGLKSGLTDLTLNEIDEANGEESDKMYAVLRKWKESLGSGASYEALALLLNKCFIHRHDLIVRYFHGKGK